jgi:hypothetical protein
MSESRAFLAKLCIAFPMAVVLPFSVASDLLLKDYEPFLFRSLGPFLTSLRLERSGR